ncbi:PREDICTED: serine-protein kinase ATM [Amphimedon queenslandica]|uniref:Serine/threonine-protein kinase ATM n=1 Tax=Amphimedon queenslandica TaxID=400682 RepID=A0AAN0JI84_AMPQE|nr:PREDICTED: serine-protein kinase ATM [Amphimedon queenslandica]|eukprot:XP_019856363.1 PREDICTED: serine-protein kinase ATM [Amphimedon queenslandica]
MNNFNDLKDMLRKSTLVKSNLDEHSSEDESVNRVASMLCTLQSVACSARSCEYHVISLLVTSTGQGHMNSDIVKKVIRRISEYLGYANEICLLEEMLSYLVSQWMNEGTIDGFPYTLLSLDNINEFYRKYYRSVVPHILATDRDSLQSISDATLLSKEDLIKESLPVTMASILKAMAHSDGDEDSKRQAKDTNEYILSVISKETLNTSLKHSLPLLVVELLTRLYVPANSDSALAQYSNVCDPEPIPPHHSLSAISTTLQYLPSCFSSSTDSFISVLAKQKEALQTIALHLNLRIFSTHRVFERKRLLISYSYFSSLVSRELTSGLHGSLPYMVMDIIYSVGRVMHHHGNDESISLICCDTLTNVTKAAIEKCPEVIGRHCHMIINTLLPLTQLPEPKNKPAIALLDYIIENGQIRALQDHLILLDPLPGEGPVKEASSRLDIIKASVNEQSLSREINRFCMVHSGNSIASDSVQGLKSLLHCLKSFHSELQINNPDTSNLILELIHTLLNTARHSPDSSCHVSQCLGEIGCIELQSISAHVVTNGGTRGRGPGGGYVFKQERDKIVASVLESLSVLLSDVSISVVKASSHCLRDVLSTNSGASVLQKLEHSVSQDDNQWFNVLEPFKQNKKKLTENLLTSVSRPLHNFSLLWKPSQDHSSWLRELVCSLITSGGVSDEVLSLVKPVCQVKLSFCESVFPLVVHDILSSNSGEKSIMESLSKQVGDFLTESVSMDPIPHQSINSVINIVMSLRKMPRLRKGGTAWENNFWLDLNFLDIANAAFKCCSYFTSLLYIEIWCNHQGFDASNLTAYPEVQGLLLQVYSQIGEHDGSYGAHLLFSPKEEFTRKLDEHEGRWEELLTYSNWEGMLTGKCNELLDKGCKSLAYYHMLDVYKKETSDSTSQQCYTENIWRLTQWRDTDDMNLLHVGTTDNYHPCLHNLLLTLKHNKKAQFDEFITKGRASIINEMVSTSLESVCNINPHLTRLQTLNELESTFQLVLEPDLSPSVLLSNWKGKLSNMSTDFELVELVLSVRFHALLSVLPYYKRSGGENESLIQSGLLNVLSTKASLAIEAQQYQIDSLLEEAKLYWSQGKADIAMLLMKDILEKLECHQEGVAYPTVLTLYGNWLSETLSERPLVILEEYLEKAVSLLESQPVNKDQLLHAYLSLARYSDNQFRRISDHMNSPLYQAKQKLLDRAKTDLQSMSKAKPDGRSTEFPKHYRQLSKLSEEDELIIRQHEQDQRQFLNKSIINYSLCLSTGEQYNLRIFRLMSLWFTSSTDPLINELIKDYVSSLPSYKLLPVIYQLAARMSSLNSDPFQHILQEMLYRLGKDHPYHSLYVILALSNAGIDNEFPQKGYVTGQRRSNGGAMSNGTKLRRSGGGAGGRGGGVGQCVVDDEKVKAAQDLLSRLRSVNGELLRDISSLCEAYVDMAYHDVTAHKTEKKPIRIPPNCPLLKLKKNKVPIPTLDHPIDPSGRYKDSMVTITSFDAHFSLCGGVNLPKVLSALCSDGKRRRQLIKGRDDLRQDAVMQQVFGLVNQLLCKKPSTANRKLLIRTYKVVPLSQCSGIVQWCEGTVPIGMYLVGPPESPLEGAHVRYRPKDWKNNECRAKFAQSSKGDKLTVYNQICKHFKPVFHHFFMESFPDPALWYERRLTYTRSIATSSIVGYIMGLGDRHVQNILIDKQSAELIHIDLGVAFEQGRALPTPEVIPFRLTRDLVSGMGITGVVGVFQRCCEETMEVMRSSHEELRTIVEVLLHDPLYIWTISNKKARHIQSSTAVEWAGGDTSGANDVSSNNKMAERVLIRLQEKLEGVENGVQLSVGGQVTHLIQEARDSVNLSSLFHGWQPWI